MKLQTLSDIHEDVLAELFNIGIGSAAALLSDMINEHVQLAVPEVSCVRKKDALSKIQLLDSSNLSAVSQNFNGMFAGNAMLIFPEKGSLELVRRILKTDMSLEELSELEADALLEVSNIILNACFSSLSETLDCTISGAIPRHSQGDFKQITAESELDEEHMFLQLTVDVSVPNHKVVGLISFILDLNALKNLIQVLDKYLERIGA